MTRTRVSLCGVFRTHVGVWLIPRTLHHVIMAVQDVILPIEIRYSGRFYRSRDLASIKVSNFHTSWMMAISIRDHNRYQDTVAE